jgi:hypothetical protein
MLISQITAGPRLAGRKISWLHYNIKIMGNGKYHDHVVPKLQNNEINKKIYFIAMEKNVLRIVVLFCQKC